MFEMSVLVEMDVLTEMYGMDGWVGWLKCMDVSGVTSKCMSAISVAHIYMLRKAKWEVMFLTGTVGVYDFS